MAMHKIVESNIAIITTASMSVEEVTADPEGDLVLVVSRAPGSSDRSKCVDTEDGSNAGTDEDGEGLNCSTVRRQENYMSSEKRRLRVSSKAMSIASPVFRAMLVPDRFEEGRALSEGAAEIELPDDDPAAFTIIVFILHHRNRQVPKKIELQTMGSLAIIVDKYQLLECMELYRDVWLPDLNTQLPTSFDNTLLEWLSIAWAFRLPEQFKHLTRVAQRGSLSNLASDGQEVPIPDIVLRHIAKDRQRAISKALSMISDTIDRYQSARQCPYYGSDTTKHRACDSMVLGSLLRSAKSVGLYPPQKTPYEGLSMSLVHKSAVLIEVSALCDFIPSDRYGSMATPNHRIPSQIKTRMDEILSSLAGLDLETFT
ncbi:hypothetical protein B0J14DRAFT_653575 [Halenospora varia]|nr:hypothetical protein B0J14DRAFT_653575 [Halenospora varia]